MLVLSIIIALCLVGALVARFCGGQALWYLGRRPINWDATLPWACGVALAIFLPTIISLILIIVLKVGWLCLLAIVLGLGVGLLSPELWVATTAWIRDPRHLTQAATGLALVAGVIIILLNLGSVSALLGSLLV